MLIDISNIGPDGLTVDGVPPLERVTLDGGRTVHLIDPRVHLEIRPGRRGHDLQGELRVRARLICVRCLGEYELRLSHVFRLTLVRGDRGGVGEREPSRPMMDDEVDVFAHEGDAIDVAAVVREQVDLCLPLNPLCRADCRGLCARCGAELNQGPCGCPETPGDSRWRALAEWRGSTKDRS